MNRINEYNSLEEFIYEYDDIEREDIRKFIGIEFVYHDKFYRMCKEPASFYHGGNDFPVNSKNEKLTIDVVTVDWKGHMYDMNYYNDTLIGWYKDIDDLLENCYIEGRKFKEVIMDDSTEIMGQD